MISKENYPQGFWEVYDRRFTNKYEALLYAKEINGVVNFKFFDNIWDNFNRELLGKKTLSELYRQRAQQLRDKYDYLILYFSGGSDSYNVLRSYIDNGIKLDEICVKWCTRVIDSDIYTPNTSDTTAYNYLSEWDYAIKPVLDEIKISNPEIKITIVNWLDDRLENDPDIIFNMVNHWHDIEVPSLATWSPSELQLVNQNKTVGSIYGVDKPCIFFKEKEACMYFTDACTTMGPSNPCNVGGVEFFYWSPDMPELAFEMAYQSTIAFLKDPELFKVKFNQSAVGTPAYREFYQLQQKKLRYILYNNWTDRFQTQKPQALDRSDKHSWIHRCDEVSGYKDVYYQTMQKYLKKLNKNMFFENNGLAMYKSIATKGFVILKLPLTSS